MSWPFDEPPERADPDQPDFDSGEQTELDTPTWAWAGPEAEQSAADEPETVAIDLPAEDPWGSEWPDRLVTESPADPAPPTEAMTLPPPTEAMTLPAVARLRSPVDPGTVPTEVFDRPRPVEPPPALPAWPSGAPVWPPLVSAPAPEPPPPATAARATAAPDEAEEVAWLPAEEEPAEPVEPAPALARVSAQTGTLLALLRDGRVALLVGVAALICLGVGLGLGAVIFSGSSRPSSIALPGGASIQPAAGWLLYRAETNGVLLEDPGARAFVLALAASGRGRDARATLTADASRDLGSGLTLHAVQLHRTGWSGFDRLAATTFRLVSPSGQTITPYGEAIELMDTRTGYHVFFAVIPPNVTTLRQIASSVTDMLDSVGQSVS
jgi:hypothetical protein